MPTQEYVNGQPVSTSASFRVYHDAAESIDDHGRLLARSGYYQQAMAEHQHPDKFAAALTGVYATDPNYGSSLISLMRRYDLYRYSASDAAPAGPHPRDHRPAAAQPGSAAIPGVSGTVTPPAQPRGSASPPAAAPQPTQTTKPEPTQTATPAPTRTATPTRPTAPGADRDASPAADPDREPGADPDGDPDPQPDHRPGADRNREPGAGPDACS